jgi:hypothetical protein
VITYLATLSEGASLNRPPLVSMSDIVAFQSDMGILAMKSRILGGKQIM